MKAFAEYALYSVGLIIVYVVIFRKKKTKQQVDDPTDTYLNDPNPDHTHDRWHPNESL